MRPGGDVSAKADGDLPELSIRRRDNPGVLQVDLRQLQRRFCAGDVGEQRIAVNDGGLQILARHFQRRFGLLDIRGALRRAGAGGIAFANR